jgi:hypothetical protein
VLCGRSPPPQAEFDLTVEALAATRLGASAWLARTLAARQRHQCTLRLHATREDGHGALPPPTLECDLLPALLAEEPAEALLACVCHGQPIDGRLGRSSTTRPRCAVSSLDLDARDLTSTRPVAL